MTERPSAIEFIKQAGLEAREKENKQRVDKIADILVVNVDIVSAKTTANAKKLFSL